MLPAAISCLSPDISGTPSAATGLERPRPGRKLPISDVLTGAGGANPAFLARDYRFLGGDTELLGNFEYRIPIIQAVSIAAFADIGSVFNLRKTGTQTIDSEYLDDATYFGAGTLTALALRNTPRLENSFGSLLLYNNRILTKTQFVDLFCSGNRLGCPISLPAGIDQLFFRGDTQSNQVIRVDESAFNGIDSFRASVGVELRVQIPVLNVPFRLIYYFNPNGKFGYTEELPDVFLPGKRSGFRFSVGRTF